jgi:ABC-type nitrate/sulfonate/bicarbonate transport system substrate-binding protein
VSGHLWRTLAGPLLAILLAAVTAGCGGASSKPPVSGGAPPAAPGAASPSAPTPAQAPVHVLIAKAVNTMGFDIANIAIQEGFMRKEGINAQLAVLGGSSVANAALEAGSAQFSMADSGPLLLALEKKLSLVSVESLDYGVPEQLIVSKSWQTAHHLSASQPLKQRLAGLKGSVFAQVGPTDRAFFEYMLQQEGVSPSSVHYVRMGSAEAAAAALEHGEIDGFQVSPPISLEVAAQGAGSVFVNYKDIPAFGQMTYDLVMTTTTYANSHPSVVTHVATALAMGNNFVLAHPAQAQSILEKLWPNLKPAVIQQSLGLMSFAKNGLQSAIQWKNAMSVWYAAGLVNRSVVARPEVNWTNRFIDLKALGG